MTSDDTPRYRFAEPELGGCFLPRRANSSLTRESIDRAVSEWFQTEPREPWAPVFQMRPDASPKPPAVTVDKLMHLLALNRPATLPARVLVCAADVVNRLKATSPAPRPVGIGDGSAGLYALPIHIDPTMRAGTYRLMNRDDYQRMLTERDRPYPLRGAHKHLARPQALRPGLAGRHRTRKARR